MINPTTVGETGVSRHHEGAKMRLRWLRCVTVLEGCFISFKNKEVLNNYETSFFLINNVETALQHIDP